MRITGYTDYDTRRMTGEPFTERPAKCACPYCEEPVRVPGDFCRACRQVQEHTRQQLRAKRTA